MKDRNYYLIPSPHQLPQPLCQVLYMYYLIWQQHCKVWITLDGIPRWEDRFANMQCLAPDARVETHRAKYLNSSKPISKYQVKVYHRFLEYKRIFEKGFSTLSLRVVWFSGNHRNWPSTFPGAFTPHITMVQTQFLTQVKLKQINWMDNRMNQIQKGW